MTISYGQTILQQQLTHGRVEDESGFQIVNANDGNYLYVGVTNSFGNGSSDVLLVKMNPEGAIIWEKSYGGPDFDRGYGIVALPNDAFILVGTTNNFGAIDQDFYLVKVDGNGNLIWQKTIGTPFRESMSTNNRPILTSDNGVIIFGMSTGTGGIANDYYVVKIDWNGNVIWTFSYDSGGFDGASSIVETADNGYLVGGTTSGGGQNETYIKIDSSGARQWVRQFQGGTPVQAITAFDGTILISGRSFTSDVFLRKMDQNGNSLWYKTYGGPLGEWNYQVLEMPDKGLLLANETVSFGAGGSDAYLVRTDAEGNELWSTTYGGMSNDWLHYFVLKSDKELIGVGRTTSFGHTNGRIDVYILRLAEIEANSTIQGVAYIDVNANCLYDHGLDNPVPGRMMKADPGGYYTFTDDNGEYRFRLDPGIYEVSKAASDAWPVPNCGLNPLTILSNVGVNSNNNFPLMAHHDSCRLAPVLTSFPIPTDTCQGDGVYQSPCPNHYFRYCFDVVNLAGAFAANNQATMSITLPTGMSFFSIDSENPSNCLTTNANQGDTGTIVWELDHALPGGDSCEVCFLVFVDSGYISHSPLSYTLQTICDGDTTDSLGIWTDGSQCACDPNDMIVMPQGCGADGSIAKESSLNYMVRFENVGDGPAHYIAVKDTLDTDLELTSVQFLQSSHTMSHFQINPGRELVFSFSNIELQSHEKGYLIFSAKLKPGLVDGTTITNEARVFFDRMPPVTTNQVLNTARENPQPIASFTLSHSLTNPEYVYDFTYHGTPDNQLSYHWEFGPTATPATSTLMNPSGITFSSAGPHTVSLSVERLGCESTSTTNFLAENFKNGNSVLICHNGHEKNVNINALPAHLDHGDNVGPCGQNFKVGRLLQERR